MKHNIIAAAILGICLVVAAFIYKGRYYVLIVNSGTVVRVDGWTGDTKIIDPTVWHYIPAGNSEPGSGNSN